MNKITSKTSFDGIRTMISEMQSKYQGEELVIIPESEYKEMLNTRDEAAKKIKAIAENVIETHYYPTSRAKLILNTFIESVEKELQVNNGET